MSNEQLIYNLLRKAGMTQAGALGTIGNWKAESGCEPCRLQNDFSPYRTTSREYTARVTSGAISRQEFARDQKGYGLAQWTYFNFQTGQGRKLDLYDFWKQSGKALDDLSMQVGFALHEMATQAQYSTLRQLLRTTNDLWTATDKVCRIFEQPYYCNVDTRFRYAKDVEAQIDLDSWQADNSNQEANKPNEKPNNSNEKLNEKPNNSDDAGEITVSSEFWPPRTIDKNMTGADVEVLQAVLKARGLLATNPDGIFGSYLETVVKQFQQMQGLAVDGVVGPLTWAALLDRR